MRALSLCNHLQRRGSSGVYYFRLRIPGDLLAVYVPKKEIVFSLKTTDPKEAKARCRVEAVRIDQEFEDHRRRLKTEQQLASQAQAEQSAVSVTSLTDLSTLQDFEIDRLGLVYLHDVLAHDEQERVSGKEPSLEELQQWEEDQEHMRQLHERSNLAFTPEPFPRVGLTHDDMHRKRERAMLFIDLSHG